MEEGIDNIFEVDIISSSGVHNSRFTLIILLQFHFGLFVIILVNSWYWNYLYYYITGNLIFPMNLNKEEWFKWLIFLLFPLNIYGSLFLFVFSIILFSAGVYKVLNWLYLPKEGVFKKGSKGWKYMHRRFWTTYFPIWLARATPLPWVDIVCYRLFGTRVGKNVVAYEGYIDPGKFVEIGDFSMTSLNICIFSHLIYHDKVLIKKVKIGKACVIGPQSIVTPGTIMKDGAILGANSYTSFGQELKGDLIHIGAPVSFTFPIQSLEESKEKVKTLGRTQNEGH